MHYLHLFSNLELMILLELPLHSLLTGRIDKKTFDFNFQDFSLLKNTFKKLPKKTCVSQ
jgi:hypothetical protein